MAQRPFPKNPNQVGRVGRTPAPSPSAPRVQPYRPAVRPQPTQPAQPTAAKPGGGLQSQPGGGLQGFPDPNSIKSAIESMKTQLGQAGGPAPGAPGFGSIGAVEGPAQQAIKARLAQAVGAGSLLPRYQRRVDDGSMSMGGALNRQAKFAAGQLPGQQGPTSVLPAMGPDEMRIQVGDNPADPNAKPFDQSQYGVPYGDGQFTGAPTVEPPTPNPNQIDYRPMPLPTPGGPGGGLRPAIGPGLQAPGVGGAASSMTPGFQPEQPQPGPFPPGSMTPGFGPGLQPGAPGAPNVKDLYANLVRQRLGSGAGTPMMANQIPL